MATFYLSAFADEAGGGIKEQIDTLKAHGMTHLEPRGLDEGNISLYTAEQAKELKKILDENKTYRNRQKQKKTMWIKI